MTDIIDRVADALYPDQGPTTLDVKFSHEACAANVSAEDLARFIHRAIVQVDSKALQPIPRLSGTFQTL